MGRSPIISIVYIVVGVIMASNRGYFVSLDTLAQIASAILAVVLWPLMLVGVNLHVVF